jgi:hypothetical protein
MGSSVWEQVQGAGQEQARADQAGDTEPGALADQDQAGQVPRVADVAALVLRHPGKWRTAIRRHK